MKYICFLKGGKKYMSLIEMCGNKCISRRLSSGINSTLKQACDLDIDDSITMISVSESDNYDKQMN